MNQNDANRRRKHRITIRLDDGEYDNLCGWSTAAGLSMNAYLRELIDGFRPMAFPPAEYREILEELRRIGVNLNQIAAHANAHGFMDERVYRREADRLWRVIGELSEQMVRGGARFGSHQDMGC